MVCEGCKDKTAWLQEQGKEIAEVKKAYSDLLIEKAEWSNNTMRLMNEMNMEIEREVTKMKNMAGAIIEKDKQIKEWNRCELEWSLKEARLEKENASLRLKVAEFDADSEKEHQRHLCAEAEVAMLNKRIEKVKDWAIYWSGKRFLFSGVPYEELREALEGGD
jgi:hypothetical protein